MRNESKKSCDQFFCARALENEKSRDQFFFFAFELRETRNFTVGFLYVNIDLRENVSYQNNIPKQILSSKVVRVPKCVEEKRVQIVL